MDKKRPKSSFFGTEGVLDINHFNDMHCSNKTKDEHNDYTENSRTEIDDLKKLNLKRTKIRMTNTKMIIQNILKAMKV